VNLILRLFIYTCCRKAMQKSGKDYSLLLVLPSGVYRYRFVVDGERRCLPDLPCETDAMGNVVNLLDVNVSISIIIFMPKTWAHPEKKKYWVKSLTRMTLLSTICLFAFLNKRKKNSFGLSLTQVVHKTNEMTVCNLFFYWLNCDSLSNFLKGHPLGN